MRLEQHEKEQFLAEAHVAVLSVPAGAGEPPLAVPVWYDYRPGGDVRILTPTGSVKAGALRASGVATLVVDTVQPRVRYVSAGCDVVAEDAGTPDFQRFLAERYLPAEAVDGYLAFAGEQLGDEVVFTLRPRRWHAADLSG